MSVDLATVMTAPPSEASMVDSVYGMCERFDEANLEADGEVAARIKTLMDEIPDGGLAW